MKFILVSRIFSREGVDPFEEEKWDKRTAEITDDKNRVVFRQADVLVPSFWSLLATNVVASKYFYGEQGTSERENSVRQLIHRVCRTIADWGVKDAYFSKEDGDVFYAELAWLCLHQYGAFNSPVWFNVGLHHVYGIGKNSTRGNWFYNPKTQKAERASTQYEYPQCSACFIQSVGDDMESIMDLAKSEAMLFKFGSGTGTDLTPLRSNRERLSGGGRPSGPLSFLQVYDQVAGIVKSGGKTRRAAKMNTLRDWHGDIEEFIEAKQKEEKKAWALIEQGYDGSFNGEAYGSVRFQNENLSVRASDEFMEAAVSGKEWWTRAVTTGKPLEKKDAARLLHKLAECTWTCGDPGMQFDSTIQKWHTCKGTEPIHSTNPCSEYVFLNNTACNLASLNLMKFKRDDSAFDVERFKAAVRLFITAQEILVDNSSYPTEEIAENSHIFRTLGLGYANLGSLIMSYGLAYDSDEARALAGAITAIMTGEAYKQSALLAEQIGAFKGYRDARCAHVETPVCRDNVESMLGVTRVNNAVIEARRPVATLSARLQTEKANAAGFLRRVERNTEVKLYEAMPGEAAMLHEMGIPIVETGDKWHYDVAQKIPLTLDREGVAPSFLREVRLAVFNHVHEQIRAEEMNSPWVEQVVAEKDCKPAAIQTYLNRRFSEKRVAYDPSDPEANKLAVSKGYVVVTGSMMSSGAWKNSKTAQAILPAGQVTPSPQPYSPDGPPLKLLNEMTPGMRTVEQHATGVAREILRREITVTFANDPEWPFGATYGPGRLTFNVGRLGRRWFDLEMNRVGIEQLLLHEFAHEFASDHLSHEYHEAICSIAAKWLDATRKQRL